MKEPWIISARKIWDVPRSPIADAVYRGKLARGERGPFGEVHPDLIRYQGYWYCCFGEPGGGDEVFWEQTGKLRIIRSRDGKQWQTVSLGDVGRRLSITADGKLMAHRYGWVKGEERVRESITYLTENGLDWSGPYTDNGTNTFRWDVAWHKGYGYCLAYCGKDSAGTMYRTPDGIHWEEISRENFPEQLRGGYEEAALAFDPETDTCTCVCRVKDLCAIVGYAEGPDYSDWTWQNARVDTGDGELKPAHEVLGTQMGGPKLILLRDGRLLLVGKADSSTPEANLGRNDLFWVEPRAGILRRWALLEGDQDFGQYAGIVEHDDRLWICCGTRSPFDVYLLQVAIPPI